MLPRLVLVTAALCALLQPSLHAQRTGGGGEAFRLLAEFEPAARLDSPCERLTHDVGVLLLDTARAATDEPHDVRIRLLRLAERAARCSGDEALLGRILNDLSDTLLGSARYADAYATAVESVDVHARLGNQAGLAEAWNRVGMAEFWRNHTTEALEAIRRGFDIAIAEGDAVGQGRALNNMANVHANRGELVQALEYLQQALAIFERSGDAPRVAVVANNIARNYRVRGDFDQALHFNDRSLALNRELGSLYRLSASLDQRGNIYRDLGAYRLALDAFDEALAIRVRLGDVAGRRETTHNIGLVHFSRGDYDAAIAAFKRGLALNRAEDDHSFEAEALRNIGAAAWRLGQRPRARANFEASLAIARREHLSAHEGEVLDDLGDMARAEGNLAESVRLLEQALAVRERIPDNVGVARSLTSLAATHLAARRPEAALESAERAAAITADLQQPDVRWEALATLGRVHRVLGHRAAARQALTQAIDVVESLSVEVEAGTSLDRRFFEDRISAYRELMALDVEEQRAAEALGLAERSRARVLAQLLKQERPATSRPAPVAVDGSTAVLEYVLTDTQLFIFTVVREGSEAVTRVTTAPIRGADISARARALRDAIAARDFAVSAAARAMYDLLIAPVASALRGRSRVIVVPDGPLWEVPFQALLGPDGYLIEHHAVSYAPSLSVLQRLRASSRQEAGSLVLAVGKDDFSSFAAPALPRLNVAESQAAGLRAVYGPSRVTTLLGPDATEARLRAAAVNARIVHLATHGVLNDAAPLSSFLALTPGAGAASDDGRLEAWETARLTLQADLVVLAACDTGRGRIATGEGVVGTMWAWLAAGARAVIVSQFQVEEKSAAAVLGPFHLAVAAGGASYAARLRDAQLGLLKDARTAHPYYWAGFVLVGHGD